MRFLSVVMPGIFLLSSTLSFGQERSMANMPLRTESADLPAPAKSSGPSVPLERTSASVNLVDARLRRNPSPCTESDGKACSAVAAQADSTVSTG
jgi:hypothetical protein